VERQKTTNRYQLAVKNKQEPWFKAV